MKRNIQKCLQKIGKNYKVNSRPIIALFHQMINSNSLGKFETFESNLEWQNAETEQNGNPWFFQNEIKVRGSGCPIIIP